MSEWMSHGDAMLAEERAARLKAEAERDALAKQVGALQEARREEYPALAQERDEALALLVQVREAFARWRAFRQTFHRDPITFQGPLADLSRLLGEGG